MFDLVIRGGTVVTPHGVGEQDVAIYGEHIAALTQPGAIEADRARRSVDAAGRIVIPGGIDPHVHCKWHMPMPAIQPTSNADSADGSAYQMVELF